MLVEQMYRPISNLPVLSKLLERLVARQLIDYLTSHKLMPDLQSSYRVHHSTETAVLKVLSDILLAVDNGDLALLTLLDLSAGRPSDASTAPRSIVQYQRHCDQLVRVLSRRPHPVRAVWRFEVNPCSCAVRGPARIGPWTDPISLLHGLSVAACPVPWVASTFVR